MRNKSAHCPLPSGEIRDPRSLPFTYGRSRGELPHILKPGCTFFVTFCLIGKGAHTTNRRREKPVRQDPIDVALDSEPPRPSVNPLLALHRAARIVEEALLFFQGNRYSLHAWCVMPDHVHCLVEDRDLVDFVKRFKGPLATRARELEYGRKLWP